MDAENSRLAPHRRRTPIGVVNAGWRDMTLTRWRFWLERSPARRSSVIAPGSGVHRRPRPTLGGASMSDLVALPVDATPGLRGKPTPVGSPSSSPGRRGDASRHRGGRVHDRRRSRPSCRWNDAIHRGPGVGTGDRAIGRVSARMVRPSLRLPRGGGSDPCPDLHRAHRPPLLVLPDVAVHHSRAGSPLGDHQAST